MQLDSSQLLLGSQLDALLTAVFSTPKIISGTAYTLIYEDNNRQLVFTSDDPVTLTVPHNLGAGIVILIIQYGAGTVTITPGTGVTVSNQEDQFDTAGEFAQCSLFSPFPDEFILAGDTAGDSGAFITTSSGHMVLTSSGNPLTVGA